MLALSHLLGVAGFFLLLLLLWRRRFLSRRAGGIPLPPELPGAWPIIGHLHLLSNGLPLAKTLAAMADTQGPMFRILLGVRPATIISSHEAARDCFTTHDRDLASRPKSRAAVLMGYNYAAFGFTEYGSYWREMRKITMLELLSNRRLENLKHVRISEVETMIKDLYAASCSEGKGATDPPTKEVVISQWLELLTLNIIIRMIAGKRYFRLSSTTDDGDEGQEANHIRRVIKEFMYISGFPSVSDLVPYLGWAEVFMGTERKMKRVATELDEIVGAWVEEHKLRRGGGGGAVDKDQDFIDVMLSVLGEVDESLLGGHSLETVIKATAMNIIVAGSDSTSLNLTWVVSLLINHRHVLEKAQEELDLKVGRDRWAQDSDVEALPYLQAIVKETLRLYPPGPLLVPHEGRKDCVVNGYLIARDTRIFVNVWKMHRDPRIWSEPEKFMPERFLTSHAGVDASGQHFEFIPFGSGRRICPGASMALQVTHLTLARLLQGFNMAPASSRPVDMTEGIGVNLPKATPLHVVLTPRLPSELYL